MVGETEAIWSRVKNHLKLHEIAQPNHTHYTLSPDPKNTRTSRIDRFYISFSEADKLIFTPAAYTTYIPN